MRNFAWFHQNAFCHKCLIDIIKSFLNVEVDKSQICIFVSQKDAILVT